MTTSELLYKLTTLAEDRAYKAEDSKWEEVDALTNDIENIRKEIIKRVVE